MFYKLFYKRFSSVLLTLFSRIYRSLLARILFKVMWKINIMIIVVEHLSRNNFLSNNQYTFHPARSTVGVLTVAIHRISEVTDNNSITRIIAQIYERFFSRCGNGSCYINPPAMKSLGGLSQLSSHSSKVSSLWLLLAVSDRKPIRSMTALLRVILSTILSFYPVLIICRRTYVDPQ